MKTRLTFVFAAVLVVLSLNRFDYGAPANEVTAPDEKIVELQSARRDALREYVDRAGYNLRTGHETPQALVDAYDKLLAAELELAASPTERLESHKQHLDRLVALEAQIAAVLKAGGAVNFNAQHESYAKAARLQAEIDLMQAE